MHGLTPVDRQRYCIHCGYLVCADGKCINCHRPADSSPPSADRAYPTSDEINALPDHVRGYIHDLETRAAPAGDVRRLRLAEDENRMLRASVTQLEAELTEQRRLLWTNHGCAFSALYGDDGEMQCGACQIDFKRLALSEIGRALALFNRDKYRRDVDAERTAHAATKATLADVEARLLAAQGEAAAMGMHIIRQMYCGSCRDGDYLGTCEHREEAFRQRYGTSGRALAERVKLWRQLESIMRIDGNVGLIDDVLAKLAALDAKGSVGE